jgi:hypothetical protein
MEFSGTLGKSALPNQTLKAISSRLKSTTEEKGTQTMSESTTEEKGTQTMSDGCANEDKGQRECCCKMHKRETEETKKLESVGPYSGMSISLPPYTIAFDPSVKMPEGYIPKCIAIAKPGDRVLSSMGGEPTVHVRNERGFCPEVILQKIHWRAKVGEQYFAVLRLHTKFDSVAITERNLKVDDNNFEYHNYFDNEKDTMAIAKKMNEAWQSALDQIEDGFTKRLQSTFSENA